MEAALTLAVIAIVKIFTEINQKDWAGAVKIVLAGLVGTAAGYFGLEGLDIWTGLASGLGAAGIVATASFAGNKLGTAIVAAAKALITYLLNDSTVQDDIKSILGRK